MMLLWAGAVASAAPSLTAKLDRQVVPVGESVTLSLTFNDVTPSGPPQLPPMQNLRVTPNISQSQQVSIVNGAQTFSFTYNYVLIAAQPGDVTIPAISGTGGGRTLTSVPLQLKIVPAAAAAAAANAMATNLAFLRLVVPKTEVYLGEPFAVEVHLYYRQAEQPQHFPNLKTDGFSVSPWPQPTRTQTQVGGAGYNVFVFRISATAARAGKLELGPATTGINLLIPSGRRQRSIFDFMDSGYERRPTTLTSESVEIIVLPLPKTDIPEGFAGAIGNFRMRVTAGPTNVAVGDPVTVRAQITGRGAFDALTLPAQQDWRDFTTYPPTAKFEASDDLGLEGTKFFEQVVIPQNPEIKSLPPFRFSFFNPDQRKYVTMVGPTIPLVVRPGANSGAPLPSLTNATDRTAPSPTEDDLIHIRPRMELAAAVPLLLLRPWFLALQAAPPLLWLALLFHRRRVEKLANNPRLRRQRELAIRIREGLKDLRAQAEGRRSEEFFATLFRLLQEQVGERLDLPASAITEAVIDERLKNRGLPDATLQSLHELFQLCNAARYARAQSSQELAALVPKLESVLRELQGLKA